MGEVRRRGERPGAVPDVSDAQEETIVKPDPTRLLDSLGLDTPPIGLYDAPDAAPFAPCVRPAPGVRACVFAFYEDWLRGSTLHLTRDAYGCRGAGACLFGVEERSREDMVEFLVGDEGLKRRHETMARWLERRQVHRPVHANVLIGPLRPGQEAYLKSVTFLVDADRLSGLVLAANYDAEPGDPEAVTAPFGSGCLQLLPPPGAGDTPRAIIGATDAAMRKHLPADTLAFTVNRSMFERLCALDEKSFLHKPFWKGLQSARGRA
jgi:hypothetical protein